MCRVIGVADLAAAVKSAVATFESKSPSPIIVGFAAESSRPRVPVAVRARAEAARQRSLARGHVIVGLVSQQH